MLHYTFINTVTKHRLSRVKGNIALRISTIIWQFDMYQLAQPLNQQHRCSMAVTKLHSRKQLHNYVLAGDMTHSNHTY